MLIFRGGAVARHDLSPSELQAHVEKWYRWSDELARQGRRNAGTALDNPGAAVRGHERVVTDGPYAESKDLVTGSMIFEAASLEDAIDVARTCPTYEFGGSVEVRPVQDLGSEARGRRARRGVIYGAGRGPVPEGVRAPGQRADPGPGPVQHPARRGRRPRRAGQCHARLALRVAAGPEGVDHPGRPQPGGRHHPPGTAPPLVPARAGDDDGAGRHDRGGTGPGRRERQPAGDDVRGVRPRPEPRDARDLDPAVAVRSVAQGDRPGVPGRHPDHRPAAAPGARPAASAGPAARRGRPA